MLCYYKSFYEGKTRIISLVMLMTISKYLKKVHKVLKNMALFLPLKKLTAPASGSDVTRILSSYNLSGTSSG